MTTCGVAFWDGSATGGGGGGGGTDVIPKIAYALLGSDQTTTSTSYVSLLSCSVTVAGTSDQVQILMSASADVQPVG